MKRTIVNNKEKLLKDKISRIQSLEQIAGTIVSRSSFASQLGLQYGGDRDIYDILGYKKNLTYTDYYVQYSRQDVAKAVINRPIEATWRGPVTVVETDPTDPENNEFAKAWEKLEEDLELKSKFIRADKLSTLGQYGVMLLGLDDVRNKEDWKNPVTPGQRTLKFVKPLGEGSAAIQTWDTKSASKRFGMPVTYNVTIQESENSGGASLLVHYTRVIHITGELLESEIEGIPYLQAIFNRLKDLEKIVGGSAEMFWRGARPGYTTTVKEGYKLSADAEEDLEDQLDEYENDLRRFLTLNGVDIKELQTQVSDPSKHVDVQIQMIAAEKGIPKRVLTGSEKGELASTQDKDSWLELVQTRREEYAEPQIINRFVNVCMEYGILPEVNSYDVVWQDLFAPSVKDKVDIGKVISEAIKNYTQNFGASEIIPPKAFLRLIGLSEEQIDMVEADLETALNEDSRLQNQNSQDEEE